MLIIGVGNLFRRDDGAGPACASMVKLKAPPGVKVLIRSGEAADLLECWGPEDEVVIIDAMKAGLVPGSFKRIDALVAKFPVEDFKFSSHSFGVAEAVELGKVLSRLPKSLVVYGIEAGETGDGEGLTPEVEKGVAEVAKRIVEETAK